MPAKREVRYGRDPTPEEAAMIRKAISGVRAREASEPSAFKTNSYRGRAVVDACHHALGPESYAIGSYGVLRAIIDEAVAPEPAPDRWKPPTSEPPPIADTRARPNDFERRCPNLACSSTMFFRPDARAVRCHACQGEYLVGALRPESPL